MDKILITNIHDLFMSRAIELAKQGRAQLRQKDSFGPLYLRAMKNTKAGSEDSKGGVS